MRLNYDILEGDSHHTLEWSHNEHDGVSNHQPHDCLFNRLFTHRSKKTTKLRVTGLCAGNLPVTSSWSQKWLMVTPWHRDASSITDSLCEHWIPLTQGPVPQGFYLISSLSDDNLNQMSFQWLETLIECHRDTLCHFLFSYLVSMDVFRLAQDYWRHLHYLDYLLAVAESDVCSNARQNMINRCK